MVNHVEVGGKSIPLNMGVLASEIIEEETGKSLTAHLIKNQKEGSITSLIEILFASIKAGYILEGKDKCPFKNRRDLTIFIDKNDNALDLLTKAMNKGMPDQEEGETPKSKGE